MTIDKCWKEDAILKIRESRWIMTLKTSWLSEMNLRTAGLQSICLTCLFRLNKAPPIIDTRPIWSNYVDVDPINIMCICNVVIHMRNLALMKAFGPKRLPFIWIINIFAVTFCCHYLMQESLYIWVVLNVLCWPQAVFVVSFPFFVVVCWGQLFASSENNTWCCMCLANCDASFSFHRPPDLLNHRDENNKPDSDEDVESSGSGSPPPPPPPPPTSLPPPSTLKKDAAHALVTKHGRISALVVGRCAASSGLKVVDWFFC